MSSSSKCHLRPNVIIAQILTLPKCHHRPNVIIAQMSSSPNNHHRPNVIIAQMSSAFSFVLWSFNVFDYYTAYPLPILFLSLYLDLSFRYIKVCTARWILQSTIEVLNHFLKVEIIRLYVIISRNYVLHVLAHWRLIIG